MSRIEWPMLDNLSFDQSEVEVFLESRVWLFYQKRLRDAAREVALALLAKDPDGPRDHWAGQGFALEYAITLGNGIAAHHLRDPEPREENTPDEQERETEAAIRAALKQEQKHGKCGPVKTGGNHGRRTWRGLCARLFARRTGG